MKSNDLLLRSVERAAERFRALTDDAASAKQDGGKWSNKEILGHLIDSATNNLHRFIRAQLSDELHFPAYEQTEWVERQNYAAESWDVLRTLWETINKHIVHVVNQIPSAKMNTLCTIGDNKAVTLEFLINDYLRHLDHHLRQIDPGF